MTETPSHSLLVREALLRDTGRELAQEQGVGDLSATKISAPEPSARSEPRNTSEFLNSLPFYDGPEPLHALPTRILLARIYGGTLET